MTGDFRRVLSGVGVRRSEDADENLVNDLFRIGGIHDVSEREGCAFLLGKSRSPFGLKDGRREGDGIFAGDSDDSQSTARGGGRSTDCGHEKGELR